MTGAADHGGRLDAAMAHYGGARSDWLDLSTGINPVAYPLPGFQPHDWQALPDSAALAALLGAARAFWRVPDGAEIVAAPGLSALIAALPRWLAADRVAIPGPTYNEYARAFTAHGVPVEADAGLRVLVHPNNPDGRLWSADAVTAAPLTVVDESFCDVAPDQSHVALADRPGVIVLKSFGKFWGLAGLRLGFAIARPEVLAPAGRPGLADLLGPWAVSGPALRAGTAALADLTWAAQTRARLDADARRLDGLLARSGARQLGGTTLFRLYDVGQAAAVADRLARAHVLVRTFPYAAGWLRLGLPAPDRWGQLERAL
jgi:cobalamin biosynthesis protein CobC